MSIQRTVSVLILACLSILISTSYAQTEAPSFFCGESPFNQQIPKGTLYTLEPRIQTVRQNQEEWSAPVYRLKSGEELPPLRSVTNNYSSRTELWSIPTNALPATAEDHHMIVISQQENVIYEFWDAEWQENGSIRAGGMHSFPINGTAISNPPTERVTAAGFAVIAGMPILEDFTDPTTKQITPFTRINHALTMSLPRAIVESNAFIAPAVGGEVAGEALADGIPMGARFALGNGLSDEILNSTYWHPLTRAMAYAARDYGIYVNDTNTAQLYDNGYVGNIRIEVGLGQRVFGESTDSLIGRVEREMATLIDAYGMWRLEDYMLSDIESCAGNS